MFREPEIPRKLELAEDIRPLIERYRETNEEILCRHIKGSFITKLNARNCVFRKVVFENCKFISGSFDEAVFQEARFINCDFSNTSISDATFKGCAFRSCKALGTDFYGSIFRHVSFTECNCADASFDTTRMSYVRMTGCNMKETSFSKCGLENMDLKDTSFMKASFFKTSLRKVDLTFCDITEIITSDEKLEFRGAILNKKQVLELAESMGIMIAEPEEIKIED